MQDTRDDADRRRAYWAELMEAAYDFMNQILAYPVQECGEPLVYLPAAAATAGVTVAFSQTKSAGLYPRLFYLREGLIADFVAVAREMNGRSWTLKVEDGYRSTEMQRAGALQESVLDIVLQRVIWELHGEVPTPEFLFRRMTGLVAMRPKVGTHMSGSAMDTSVLWSETGAEVERGGRYIELSELTPMDSPFVSEEAARNRAESTAIWRRHGFVTYPYEFWHYNKGDAYDEYLTGSGKPARYGAVDFDPVSGRITPIRDPDQLLHSMEDIRRQVDLALERRRSKKSR